MYTENMDTYTILARIPLDGAIEKVELQIKASSKKSADAAAFTLFPFMQGWHAVVIEGEEK